MHWRHKLRWLHTTLQHLPQDLVFTDTVSYSWHCWYILRAYFLGYFSSAFLLFQEPSGGATIPDDAVEHKAEFTTRRCWNAMEFATKYGLTLVGANYFLTDVPEAWNIIVVVGRMLLSVQICNSLEIVRDNLDAILVNRKWEPNERPSW